jgi:type VI secretion system protein ImpF
MAELTAQERLQPSLLDRLTDDDSGSQQEPRDKRVLSMRGLRRAVLRDLGWIFNSTGLGVLQDLDAYPHAGGWTSAKSNGACAKPSGTSSRASCATRFGST